MRRALAAIAVVSCALGARADSTAAPQAPAQVFGAVTAMDTGRPIGGAEVRLESRDRGANRVARTDSSGRYEIAGVAPGAYVVRAGAARFVPLVLGDERPDGSPAEIAVRSGERLELNAVLRRYGAVAGRVVDQFGDPLPGVSVVALQRTFVDGMRRLVPAGGTLPSRLTDDLGRFRLHTLGPGEYLIVALGGPLTAVRPYLTRNDTGGFLPTFSPSALSVREAVPIALGPGEEREGVTIAMVPGRGVRVSGTAIDSRGLPFGRALMSISSSAAARAGAVFAGREQASGEGSFAFSNVPPGDYVIQARSLGTAGAFTGEFGWLEVSVGGDDLADLVVQASPGSAVKVRVTVDYDAVGPSPPRFGATPIAVAADLLTQPVIPTGSGSAEVIVGERIEAELRQVWGRQLIRILPGELFLKSVTVDGRDVTDTPIEFRGQPVIADVVLTSATGRLTGRVLDAEDKPAGRCTVIVFAADRALWTVRSRFVHSTTADRDGNFVLPGVAPGHYLAVALASVDVGRWTDPEFLSLQSGPAMSLTINAGETRSLELRLAAAR